VVVVVVVVVMVVVNYQVLRIKYQLGYKNVPSFEGFGVSVFLLFTRQITFHTIW
jgi:hypothetical protein